MPILNPIFVAPFSSAASADRRKASRNTDYSHKPRIGISKLSDQSALFYGDASLGDASYIELGPHHTNKDITRDEIDEIRPPDAR